MHFVALEFLVFCGLHFMWSLQRGPCTAFGPRSTAVGILLTSRFTASRYVNDFLYIRLTRVCTSVYATVELYKQ